MSDEHGLLHLPKPNDTGLSHSEHRFSLVLRGLRDAAALSRKIESICLAAVQLDGKWGFVGKDGRFVVEPKYARVKNFHCGRALFSYSRDVSEGKWGYLDISGNEIIPECLGPAYFMYGGGFWDFREGLARVKVDGLFGYIDKDGVAAIKPVFEYARPFINGSAAVGTNGMHRFIDTTGNFIGNVFTQVAGESDFHSPTHSLPAKFGAKWGFINCQGELISEPIYESIQRLETGSGWCAFVADAMSLFDDQGSLVLTVERKRHYGCFSYYNPGEGIVEREIYNGLGDTPCRLILNTDGQRIFCEEEDIREAGYFSDGVCPVYVEGDSYYINKKGERITGESISPVGGFDCGRGIIQSGDLYGYIDNFGNLLTPVHFTFAHPYSGEYAHALTMQGEWQWIDLKGNIVDEPSFAETSTARFLAWPFHKPHEEPYPYNAFREAMCCIELDGKHGFVDTRCRLVIPPLFDAASHFVNGLSAVKDQSGKFGFIDKTGAVVIPCKFDRATDFHVVE